ncbi:MAG TPA: sodium/glutamate symporter [Candidatus Heimdallarchaeota archaeon]|nr:sodium/glutamate symporter [Candidatus Heimdallarchaeota archaeon]
MTIVTSFCGLCLLLVIGKFLRVKVKFIQRLYLPSAVIGGIIGLILVQISGSRLDNWTVGWTSLPGFLINIVFASLFLGAEIPSLSVIWDRAAPQLAYGQIVAWGQWVVGLGFVMILLGPLFKVPDLFGAVLPIGFEGGHGTAGGLRDAFIQLGWNEGSDFSLASATAGIISAIIVGVVLINWAAKKGYVSNLKQLDDMTAEELAGLYPIEKRPSAGQQTVSADSIDSVALHLAIIGIAIFIGYSIKVILMAIENQFFGNAEVKLFAGFPLFPLCMIGGLIVQLVISRHARISPVDHKLMQRLGGTALDFLVVAAISTISIEVIAKGIVPFSIIIIGGIVWNIFCVRVLARRMLPNFWFERAIAEMGKSMGVTATGLLLLRIVDPEQETEAASAFGYKQLLHEPFMGGGLWTSIAVILIAQKGGWLVLGIAIVAIVAWLVIWRLFLKKKMQQP